MRNCTRSSHAHPADRSSLEQVASTFGRVLDVTDIHTILEQDAQLQGMLKELRPEASLEHQGSYGHHGHLFGDDGDIISCAGVMNTKKMTRRQGGLSGWLHAHVTHRALKSTAKRPDGLAGEDEDEGFAAAAVLFGVIHPNGRFRTMWNLVMTALILYSAVVVPMQLAFWNDFQSDGWRALNYVIDVVFILDIIVNFRTGFIVGGHYVNDPWASAIHYLRGGFAVDFVGSFPLNVILDATSAGSEDYNAASRVNRLLRLFRMFKLARMLKLAKYTQNIELLQHNPGVMRIMRLSAISLLLCHLLGCIWWLVADLERTSPPEWFGMDRPGMSVAENLWMPEAYLVNASLALKLTHSFYWGAGMVTSLVPRDVEPATFLETVVTILAMFTGLIFHASVISALTSAMSSLDSSKAIKSEKLEAVKNYLQFKGIGGELKGRIIEFYEYLLTSSQSGEHERALLKDIPTNLSMQLAISVNKRLIKPVPYFATFTDTALLAIVAKLKPLIFVPSQVVVKDGTTLKAIYFINRGIAQILRHLGTKEERLIGGLQPLDHFGLESFVRRGKVKVSLIAVRTVTYCDMMGLAISDLTAIIAANNLEWAQERAAAAAEEAKRNEQPQERMKVRSLGLTSGFIKRLRLGGGAKKRPSAIEAEEEDSFRASVADAGAAAAGDAAGVAARRCRFAFDNVREAVAGRKQDGSIDGFHGSVAAMVAKARRIANDSSSDVGSGGGSGKKRADLAWALSDGEKARGSCRPKAGGPGGPLVKKRSTVARDQAPVQPPAYVQRV